jgi:hypothetical protein
MAPKGTTVAPANLDKCIPWRISGKDSPKGPRIGGRGPNGQGAWKIPKDAEYFGTFPLARFPDLEFSLYVRPYDVLVEAQNGGPQEDRRVCCFAHPPSSRGKDRRFESSLKTRHGIVLGRIRSDLVKDEETHPYSDHKIGGRPYCIQEPELPEADALFEQGFIQALQVDFPGAKDGSVSGDWPFGGGLFNLFLKPPFGPKDVRWYLQD